MTLLTGIATLHGNNLTDTPYDVPPPLVGWLDIATLAPGTSFTQASAEVHRADGWDDWTAHPDVTARAYDGSGSWTRLDGAAGPWTSPAG